MDGHEIEQFLKNQTLFITGGTGFLGKVLIEKVLRVCELKKIYVLIRPKKGKSVEERIDDFFDFPCFDRLRNDFENVKKRVCFIFGDCEAINFGMTDEDEQLLINETNIVIHAAANVKFDQSLRVAANTNVRSTISAVTLAKKMPQLKAFVYVSTAYSNCIHEKIKEEFYSPPMSYQQLFSILDGMDDDTLERITPKLLGKWPNTYIYTKSISEDAVKTLGHNLPVAIVRPGIVVPSAEEPIPGWIDNLYGVVGVTVAVSLGVLRTMRENPQSIFYAIPVDYVANLVLAAAWNIHRQERKVIIYNFVGHKKHLLTVHDMTCIIETECWKVCTTKSLWYPSLTLVKNEISHKICIFFMHTIPAYLADCVLFCMGRPRIAVAKYQRLHKSMSFITYFNTNTWSFDDSNLMELCNTMSDVDKNLFRFNMEHINWNQLIQNAIYGGRTYLLKEPTHNISEGKRKFKKLFVLHYTLITVFVLMSYKLFMFIIYYVLS